MLFRLTICLTLLGLPGGLMEIITDYADSIAGMKTLVDMEGLFISELTNYTNALKNKIDTIESFLKAVQVKREFSRRNPAEFVAHPLNAFALIRRLHEDWTYLELFMSRREGQSHLQAIKEVLTKGQPTEKDMENALYGMMVVQRFYNQEPVDMAKGVLLGRQYNASMTSLECLALANTFRKTGNDQHVISWYKAALQQYDELRDGQVLEEVFDFKINELYKNVSSALAKAGFKKAAINILREVSELDAELWLAQRKMSEVLKVDMPDPTEVPFDLPQNECERKWSAAVKNLSCYYATRSAFLTIAPLKTEMLHENPYIVMYHDVIYDIEISRIKKTSLPTLKSPPKSYLNGDYVNIKYTTIYEEAQSRLNQRIRDMTGSEVKEDEGFQIYNTGIGGILDHYDQTPGSGDHPTTIVLFLNNATEGGAISFTDLKLTVFPQKGSALVWHNQPTKLKHMVYPVVLGSKWTLVKWLNEGPQVFAKPYMEKFHKLSAEHVSKA